MPTTKPTQASRHWLRMVAVLAVWVPAAVALGVLLASPLAIAILTAAILAVSHVYAQFESTATAVVQGGGRNVLRDDVTNLATGPCAEHFIEAEFAAARRGRPLALVMFGFDNFDAFTQRAGPDASAAALRKFGQLLNRSTRQMNLSARYGWRADAFLSVLSHADADAAEVFVNRVTAAASNSSVPLPPLSVAVVEYRPAIHSPQEFVELVERALEEARADGGGRRIVRADTSSWGGARRRLRAL